MGSAAQPEGHRFHKYTASSFPSLGLWCKIPQCQTSAPTSQSKLSARGICLVAQGDNNSFRRRHQGPGPRGTRVQGDLGQHFGVCRGLREVPVLTAGRRRGAPALWAGVSLAFPCRILVPGVRAPRSTASPRFPPGSKAGCHEAGALLPPRG